MKRQKYRQMLVMLLVVALLLPNLQSMTVLAQGTSHQIVYESDGYSVCYDVLNEWEGGMQVDVVITNTSSNTIHNWEVSFDLKGSIQSIWNASIVSHEEDNAIIQNIGYNSDIPAGQSVNFGYVLIGDDLGEPNEFILSQEEVHIVNEYDVNYVIENDWNMGFHGYIEITNHTNEPIKCWNLRFDSNVNLDNMWEVDCVVNCGRYEVTPCEWNSVIPANGSLLIRFMGSKEEGTPVEIIHFELSEITTGTKNKTDDEVTIPEETTPEATIEEQPNYDLDSDSDGLADCIEKKIGTEIDNPDSDGDGFFDGYEIYFLGTDPRLKDTDNNGITDGEEDFDEDGLTNLEEFHLGTKIFEKDSDQDGLTDYEEVRIYGTNPNLDDTDLDGVLDGEEVLLGLNPNGLYTDGVLDTQVILSQHVTTDANCLKEVNSECEEYQLALDIVCSGYALSNLNVTKSPFSKVMNNSAIIGGCPDIRLDNGFIFESMELQFSIEENVINNQLHTYSNVTEELEGIKRYNVFHYLEDIDMMLPVPTSFDVEKGVVSATVREQGTYCVMDLEQWLTELGFEYEGYEEDEIQELSESSMLFSTFSMNSSYENTSEICEEENVESENGYVGDFGELYNRITLQPESDFSLYNMEPVMLMSMDEEARLFESGDIVFLLQGYGKDKELFEFEKAAILEYARLAYHLLPDARIRVLCTRKIGIEIDTLWTNSYAELEEQLTDITYQTSKVEDRYMSKCLNKAMNYFDYRDNALPFIVWVTNSDVYYDMNYEYYSPELLLYEDRVASGIIGSLGKDSEKYYTVYIDLHGDMNEKVSFCYTPLSLANRGVAHMYNQLYHKINNQKLIITQSGLTRLPIDFGRISPSSENDYDQDGLLDCEEIDFKGWKIVLEDTPIVDLPTYAECIEKYQGVYSWDSRFTGSISFRKAITNFFERVKVLPIISSPIERDSDGDEIEDYWDRSPMEKLDVYFQVIEKYDSYDVLNTIPLIKIEEKIEEDKKYNTKNIEPRELLVGILDYLFVVEGGKLPLCGWIFPIVDGKMGEVQTKWVPYEDAAENMEHYLENTGKLKYMDNFGYAVAYTRTQRYFYYKYMNQYMDMVENTIKCGRVYSFSSNPHMSMLVEFSKLTETPSEMNWWLAVGDAHNTIVSDVYCKQTGNCNMYYAKVKFNLIDYYNWDGQFFEVLNDLHLEGLAKNYFAYGIYETTISWKEGARFQFDDIKNIQIEQINQEDIYDENLLKQYSSAKKYYEKLFYALELKNSF